MSDAIDALAIAPIAAPVSVPVAAPVASAPVAAAKPAEAPSSSNDMSFLKDRLEREKRSTLKALGIKIGKNADAGKAIEEAKAKLDDRKSERRALKTRVAELEAQVSQSGTATGAIKVYADAALNDLDPKQQEAIKSVAGDNPEKVLEAIAMFKKSGAFSLVPAPAAPAPIAQPANTTPPGGAAPTPATAGTTQDIKAQYKTLKASSDPYDAFRAQVLAGEFQSEILG